MNENCLQRYGIKLVRRQYGIVFFLFPHNRWWVAGPLSEVEYYSTKFFCQGYRLQNETWCNCQPKTCFFKSIMEVQMALNNGCRSLYYHHSHHVEHYLNNSEQNHYNFEHTYNFMPSDKIIRLIVPDQFVGNICPGQILYSCATNSAWIRDIFRIKTSDMLQILWISLSIKPPSNLLKPTCMHISNVKVSEFFKRPQCCRQLQMFCTYLIRSCADYET